MPAIVAKPTPMVDVIPNKKDYRPASQSMVKDHNRGELQQNFRIIN
jgi:hypothetical protein